MGASGAGHQLHGKRGDASARDLLHDIQRAEGAQKSDEDLVTAKKRHILFPRHVVGAVAKNLHNNVSGKHCSAVGDELCTLVRVLGIRIAGLTSGTGLYVDFETRFGQRWED